MRIRTWELAAAIVGLLVALLYILTGALAVGIGIGAAVSATAFTRMRPRERPGVAGGYARRSAQLETAALFSLFGVALAVLALIIATAIAGWAKHGPEGVVAVFALYGLFLMLAIELERRFRELENRSRGAYSEEAVGAELDRLPADRWFVTHDWLKERGGNIDHIAIAPHGAFAIETKSRRYLGRDGAQAIGAAMEVRRVTGISWVTAVVCVPGDDEPVKKQNVWLVPLGRLAQWLQQYREHHGLPVDMQAARAALTR